MKSVTLTTETNVKDLVAKILVNHGLDFSIEKLPMFGELSRTFTTIGENGTLVLNTTKESIVSDYYGLMNSKSRNIINTVKAGYTVTQNDEIIETVVRGMQGFGELSVQKAGSINDGRKVFIQLKIEGLAKVGNDSIERYITIIDSNDGSTGLSVGCGDLTMSCQNQFFKFYKKGTAKFLHTASITEKIKALPELITLALSESMKLIELYNKFQSTPVTRALCNQLVKELVGLDKTASAKELSDASGKQLKAMETLYSNIENQTNDKGLNLWGLHSGTTRWTTFEKQSPKRENGRIESSMMGTNYNTNQQSLDFCIKQLELV